jgi:uncharacterized protein (DUF1015 family)
MIHVKPFRGVRPIPEKVSEVASPPYDVLNSEEAREKAKDRPLSFLHVVKPEIDLNPSIDLYDPRVYAKGAENLKSLIKQKILIQDEKPCFYIYKLRMGDHTQVGLVAVASVEDYIQNRIKKHENTRPDKEQDRVNHIDSLNAQTGPVFLTYRAKKEIDDLIKKGMEKDPVYDFIGDYNVQHTFYVVDDDSIIHRIGEEFSRVESLYVADGHHRSAAATRVREMRIKQNPQHTGDEEYNFFLSVIFPDSQMRILDYNRTVADLKGILPEEFLNRVEQKFVVQSHDPNSRGITETGEKAYRPREAHTFGMYMNGQWYKLTAKEGSFNPTDPIGGLDVSILQENLLSPILGIENPRTDKRIHFVGGIRGLEELQRLVDGGNYAVAFSLYPTSIHQLLMVSDAGKVMPPKSTWFEPKLRSGVVVHMLD